ncbi:MAG: FmdE family protein [Planctomycetia bacterium]|nr:FmdE family protein [Planctomycetia bacterium]
MACTLTSEEIAAVVAFHGHHCPGLTIGIRAGEWCRNELGRAEDEEMVAVTETDMCGVDAVMFLTGCTLGKGNLVYRDYGKVAFSFYRRRDGRSARLLLNRSLTDDLRQKQAALAKEDVTGHKALRQAMIERMMDAKMEEMFRFLPVQEPVPQFARIHRSLPCAACGEEVMETRLLDVNGRKLCIYCNGKNEIP